VNVLEGARTAPERGPDALAFAPSANAVLSSVRQTETGQASGATNAIREVGGVMGVAVLAGVFAAKGGYTDPQAFTDGVSAALVLCGHSHHPRIVRTAAGQLIVNPGSVGLPAYDDAYPHWHVIENGAPDARYAIVEQVHGDWQAQLLAVPYDHESMARLAEQRGQPDWAHALRTGYMPRLG